MRWLSPPDRVPLKRATASDSRGRHRPGSFSRSRISLRMRPAISFCLVLRGPIQEGAEPLVGGADRLLGDFGDVAGLSILTASASGFSRLPLQASQGWPNGSARSPRASRPLSVSRQRRSRFGITPSKVLVVFVGAQPVVVDEGDLGRCRSRRGWRRAPWFGSSDHGLSSEKLRSAWPAMLQRLQVIGRGRLGPRRNGAPRRSVSARRGRPGRDRPCAPSRARRRSGRRRTGC